MIDSLALFSNFPAAISNQIIKLTLSIPHQEKIAALTRTCFQYIQKIFLGIYGSHQLLFEKIKPLEKVNNANLKNRVQQLKIYLHGFLFKREFEKIPFGYHAMHGALYLSSGIFGFLSDIESCGIYRNLGSSIGSGLFLFANLLGIEYNVSIYLHADSIDLTNAPAYQCEAVKALKKSAAMGIITNLNYVLFPISIFFGLPVAVSILFAGIAAATGCLKILYDYFFISI